MQVEPSYEYSALPTDDYDNQLPKEKFSPQQIFLNTINSTINHLKNGNIETSTNRVDEHLLNDADDLEGDGIESVSSDDNDYMKKLLSFFSKCNCNNLFNLNYFFD